VHFLEDLCSCAFDVMNMSNRFVDLCIEKLPTAAGTYFMSFACSCSLCTFLVNPLLRGVISPISFNFLKIMLLP
jgi:hypothetical protein